MLLDELYWKYVCKFKNYYNGNDKIKPNNIETIKNKLCWMYTYLSISDNKDYLHRKDLPDLVRGNIILVEIGDNLGMEFRGKHHCIVLRDSPKNLDQVFVLPITSKKPQQYNPNYNGIYIEISRITGFNGYYSPSNPHHRDTGKHWANILNIRNISKSRIYYPTKIRNVSSGQLNKISNSIIANIALRRDLLNK